MAKRYSVFQWLFSFITPVIIHKDQSEVNSILETTLENGKLVLNSAHANYSYGSLFRVFIKALLRFNIDIKNKKKILVLGMGGGSVVKFLLENNTQAQLDTVEIDRKIISIAKEMFDLSPSDRLKIYAANAVDYLKDCREEYDLILIDLFIDDAVPEFCFTESFWKSIQNICLPKCDIVFNASMKQNYLKHNLDFLGAIHLKEKFTIEQNLFFLLQPAVSK